MTNTAPPNRNAGWNASHGYATQYAIEGIRAILLANGGAIVAILSFCGNADPKLMDVPLIVIGLKWFIAGLALAIGTTLNAFMAQGHASHDRRTLSTILEVAGILTAIASLCAFTFGAMTSVQGFHAPQ